MADVGQGLCHAFLWERSEMLDLNALVRSDANAGGLYLFLAFGINDDEEITGWGLTSAGDIHAFLATPVRRHAGDWDGAAGGAGEHGTSRPHATLSKRAQKLLLRALARRNRPGEPQ
jgi:hypothetical protein